MIPVVLVVTLMVIVIWWQRETVVTVPVDGHPGRTVDFVLCHPMIGEFGKRGWIVRWNGAETKMAQVSGEVPEQAVREGATAFCDGRSLSVLFEGKELFEVPGYCSGHEYSNEGVVEKQVK
jgi:hypothetical protein